MKKKYVLAVKAVMKNPYPTIEILTPLREHDTFEEAEKDVEAILSLEQNAEYVIFILTQYSIA